MPTRSMEPLWSPAVATSGNRWQMRRRHKPQKQAKSVAPGCHRLPANFHGKEGVDGSSPSEGSAKAPLTGLFGMCSVGVEGHQGRYGAAYGAFAQRSRSGERGNRVATGFRGEGVAEVGVERAALQPAGLVDGEQPFDRAFAALGTAAE
jgi:hypothetical protein